MNQNTPLEDLPEIRVQASVSIRRKSEFFDYMVSEHLPQNSSHAPYHILNRGNARQVPSTLKVQTLVQTRQRTQPLSLHEEEPAIHSHDAVEEEVSLIDDHDPVPEFIHHPRWALWIRPRRTFRFIINQAPMLGKGVIFASGLALASKLISMYQSQLGQQGINLSWQLGFLACVFIGLVCGSFVWRWERLVHTHLGRLFGGKGNLENIGQAMLWSYVPVAASMLWHIVGILIWGQDYLSLPKPAPMWLTVSLISIHVYSFVLSVILVSEAHKFGWLRSILLRVAASACVYGPPIAIYAWYLGVLPL